VLADAYNQGFLKRFRDPFPVTRIENRVPRVRENYHRVPRIRESGPYRSIPSTYHFP